ncbi:MAG: hypothetical protein AAGK37_19135 [Pseudomonadota bacterium]
MKLWIVFGFLFLGACAVPTDVSNQMAALSGAAEKSQADVAAIIKKSESADRAARIAASARAKANWSFVGFCEPTPQSREDPNACRLNRGDAYNDLETPSSSIERKMNTIALYLGALETLSKSTSEDELIAAGTAVRKAFGDLAEQLEAEQIVATLKRFEAEDAKKLNAVVSAVIANRRYRALRTLVLSQQENFNTVVDETIAQLAGEPGIGAPLLQSFGEMADARDARSRATTPEQIRAALTALDVANRRHLAQREMSVLSQLVSLARAHTALADRLRQGASAEDVVAFVESIGALYQIIDT